MTYDFKDFTEKQRKFCEEYVLCLNTSEAARRAGFKSSASVTRIWDLPYIQPYIDFLVERRAKRLEPTQDAVIARLWTIATADRNELVQYRRVNCRFCWGEKYRYQWTDSEYERARSEADRLGWPIPGAPGGAGFKRDRDPNPDCPECSGEGDGKIHAQDTRKLSEAGKIIYAGAEQGRDGLKIKSLDPIKALELVGRYLGMFKDKVEHSGEVKSNGPVLNLTLAAPPGTKIEAAEKEEEDEE